MRSSKSLSRLRLAVAGGGVLGLSIAALAGSRGARVTVFEPRAVGDNASGVAAGMLSPALEAVLDGQGAADHALFQDAYDAWPAFAGSVGLTPPTDHAAGALYLGHDATLDALAGRLAELDVAFERVSAARAALLQPGLAPGSGDALRLRDEGRVDVGGALESLVRRLQETGGAWVAAACSGPPAPGFDATLIATGFEARTWAALAPELGVLRPIKGHVLHFHGGLATGPTLRSLDGYAAPQPGGTVFGATMEPGRADLDVEAGIAARLQASASALLPALARTPFTARAGVRAATPDGRPLVGPTRCGLHLAVGARRNGWLLAPIIAEAVLEGLQGGAARTDFDPGRFGA